MRRSRVLPAIAAGVALTLATSPALLAQDPTGNASRNI